MKKAILLTIIAAWLVMSVYGCGVGFGDSVTGEYGKSVSVVSAGPQPWMLDWSGEMRQDMSIRLSRGLVLVRYDEEAGELKLLPSHCLVEGSYLEGKGLTRPRQTEEIKSSKEVHAKLGIKIAQAEAGFEKGNTWKLDYTVSDVRAADRMASRNQIPAGCEEATHYVSQVYLGAYIMDTGDSLNAGVSAGAGIGPVEGEVGGSGQKSRTLTLKDGDVEKCLDVKTPASDAACLGLLKIELMKLE